MTDPSAASPVRSRPKTPAITGAVLARGTLLTLDLERLSSFASECLGLETVKLSDDRIALRDTRALDGETPFWVLDARKVAAIEHPQTMLNHWGVTVESFAEVDAAFEKISAVQEKYGLKRLQRPRNQHGSYSFYIADADSNWWEIEAREPGARYPELADLAARADA